MKKKRIILSAIFLSAVSWGGCHMKHNADEIKEVKWQIRTQLEQWYPYPYLWTIELLSTPDDPSYFLS